MTTTTTGNWMEQVTAVANQMAERLPRRGWLEGNWQVRFTVVLPQEDATFFASRASQVHSLFSDAASKREIHWHVGRIRLWLTKGPRGRVARTLRALDGDTTVEARVRVELWGYRRYARKRYGGPVVFDLEKGGDLPVVNRRGVQEEPAPF
jgi:hypothetical protein